MPDIRRGILLIYLLSVEEILVLDLLIAACVVCVSAFAITLGMTIIIVGLGVFQTLEGFQTFATTPCAFPIGFLRCIDLASYPW